ncbi:hypothetical protein [Nocardia fusca]|uniref:hypothetical protein n=1 Tax=Nocardia fusca TaxID=941183 RepID=UPI0012F50C28|nr:hypothetical protein [Nocardia fusca]
MQTWLLWNAGRRMAVGSRKHLSGYLFPIPHQAANPRNVSVERASCRANARTVSCTIGWYRVLRRLADGLRTLPAEHPTAHCRSHEPIRGYAHAHQVMDVHAAHRCPRYAAAAEYAAEARR